MVGKLKAPPQMKCIVMEPDRKEIANIKTEQN